jgi:hypothetical protein
LFFLNDAFHQTRRPWCGVISKGDPSLFHF